MLGENFFDINVLQEYCVGEIAGEGGTALHGMGDEFV